MTSRSHRVFFSLRLLLLFFLLVVLAFLVVQEKYYPAAAVGLLCLLAYVNIHKYLNRRFVEINDFFEAVKYRDFSRRFVEDLGPRDIQQLHRGFNEVNQVVREINMKKEVQYLYLQKILEMVDIGIIAYNVKSGAVLWANDSIKETLDLPSFKNISFVEKRKPLLYEEVFGSNHSADTSMVIHVKNEKLKVLISDTIFQIEEETYKLIVLQNIDETLDQNESEAWKKLLSVMTHEIMNSIAPISSLADTLQNQIRLTTADPENYQLDMEDLETGINSIKKRSEGLMKFAKTYRSLNRVTQLNLQDVRVSELFETLEDLMQVSLKEREVQVEFVLDNPELEVKIDTYLVEQVLINLMLNAMDAVQGVNDPKVTLIARKRVDRDVVISVIDNGNGIPAEIMDSIFVPFFSTKKHGSGIGLSLCKQIMLLHKGKIQVNSIEGKGTAMDLIFTRIPA